MNREAARQLADAIGLHPSYRNLMATTAFVYYFDTQQTDHLTGVDGAFRLYETDRQTHTVIRKVEAVAENLNQMTANLSRMHGEMAGYHSELLTKLEDIDRQIEGQAGGLATKLENIGNSVDRLAWMV